MDLTAHQRLFLEAICRHFHTMGGWPTYGWLDRTLRPHRDLDVEVVGRELDGFMHDSFHAPLYGWDPNQIVVMNVSALQACYVERIYLDVIWDITAFGRIVKRCIERYEAGEEETAVKDDMFEDWFDTFAGIMDRAMFRNALGCAFRLLQVEGFFKTASYDEDGPAGQGQVSHWQIIAPTSIRKYRDVETIEEYLAVRNSEMQKLLGNQITSISTSSMLNEPRTGGDSLVRGVPAFQVYQRKIPAQVDSASPVKRAKHPVFISYRRDDSSGYAGRLHSRLERRYGRDMVFMDLTIESGEDFVAKIQEAVSSCTVLLAIIGMQWLTATDTASGMRRLDNPEDFVRIEISAALQHDKRVIPVLVHGAKIPGAANLPDILKPLATKQAHELTDQRWRYDVGSLVRVIDKLVGYGM